MLTADGRITREDLIQYIKSLFEEKLERSYSEVWDYVVASAIEIYPEELYDHLKWVYDSQLVNTKYLGFHWVKCQLDKDRTEIINGFYQNPANALINDIVKEFS